VLTRSPERAGQARSAHPGVRIVEDVGALLQDADVLVVATPNREHVSLATAGLERGLHVVVDKPLAPTAAEARALAETADGRLTVFQNRRWDGDFLTLQRLVAEDRLGPVLRFESRFERFRPEVDPAAWRESGDPAAGGGLLLDLGAHLIDQALVLLGPVVEVHAELDRRRPGAQVEDDVFVALRHAGGARSHLWMSVVAPLAGPRFRVSGTRAGFACDGLDAQEAQLRSGGRPGDAGFGESGTGRLGDEPVALERGRYVEFYEGVRDWVAGASAAPVGVQDAVEVLEIIEAARRRGAPGS
jgi:predicted dehydrogenase